MSDSISIEMPGGERIPARDYARRCAKHAAEILAHAFNHGRDDGLPYRYSDAAQTQFETLCRELMAVVDNAEIVDFVPTEGRTREADADFHRFLFGVINRPDGTGLRDTRGLIDGRADASDPLAPHSTTNEDLITTNALSPATLKSILDAAHIQCTAVKDVLVVRDIVKCIVYLPSARDRIVLYASRDAEPGTGRARCLDLANEINRRFAVVKCHVSDRAGRLSFGMAYEILVNDGLAGKSFVSTLKRFCAIVLHEIPRKLG